MRNPGRRSPQRSQPQRTLDRGGRGRHPVPAPDPNDGSGAAVTLRADPGQRRGRAALEEIVDVLHQRLGLVAGLAHQEQQRARRQRHRVWEHPRQPRRFEPGPLGGPRPDLHHVVAPTDDRAARVDVQTNAYRQDLYNGDTGIIVRDSEGELQAIMEGRDACGGPRIVPAGLLPPAGDAWAETIR